MNLDGKQIDKNARVPLYFQLKEVLLDFIRASPDGHPIPTEIVLGRQFGLSRPTVRQAVSELANEGLLKKSQGRGTFVCKKKVERDFRLSADTFEKEMLTRGRNPLTVILALETIPVSSEIASALAVAMNREVYFLKRLRYTDDVPLVLTASFLPADLVPGLDQDSEALKTLHKTLEQKYGHRLDHAHRSIEAIRASGEIAALLQVPLGDPLQYIENWVYLANNRCIHYWTGWYRGDRSRFTIDMHRREAEIDAIRS